MNLFTATDPRGISVTLTKQCWESHVLMNHPEMYRLEHEVRTTVESPDMICESKHSRSSHLYFRRVEREGGHLFVCVDVRESTRRGFVQTSFFVDNCEKGGRVLWSRS